MKSEKLISAIEKQYEVQLPERYKQFLRKGEFAELGRLHLIDGFVRGTFKVDFVDEDLLDLGALGENHAIDDIDDIDWPGEFADFVPFATLADAEDDEELVRSFLVLQVSDAACPISLWDYDGWTVYPLARSLDEFLKGQAGKTLLKHERLASPYKKFAWVKAADDADEADEG